jgi:hypothetical protein
MPAPSLEDMTVDQLREHAAGLQSQAQLFAALTGNPETRETVQRALKKLNPKLSIPEIDAKDAVLAAVADSNKSIAELRQQILERDVRERLEREKGRAITEHHLSTEDVKGVEALMIDKENPISSYDIAAKLYKASRQSAVPTPVFVAPPTFTMPEKDIWGKGIGNRAMLDRIALNEAFSAWNEIKTGKVPGLGAALAA